MTTINAAPQVAGRTGTDILLPVVPGCAAPQKPVLFSGAMVRAILAGTKTQTRRIVKSRIDYPVVIATDKNLRYGYRGETYAYSTLLKLCPYGTVGSKLWVRETFLLRNAGRTAVYRADMDAAEAAGFGAMYGGWKPSIFMPRWASRIKLEITDIRVQRLQEISEEDAKAEGCRSADYATGRECILDPTMGSYRWHFESLWDTINKKRAPWDSNPWVWCLSLRRIDG